MKIALTSDLHLDYSEENRLALKPLAEIVRQAEPDVLVVAGDVANSIEGMAEGLQAFRGVTALRLFVPGNHDLWVESRDEIRHHVDSCHKYRNLIPAICKRVGFHDLSQRPFIVGDTAFVGSPGWYDFSLKNPALDGNPAVNYERGLSPAFRWDEYTFLHWPVYQSEGDGEGKRVELTPPEICRMMCGELESQIKSVAPHVERIVAVIHTLPGPGLLCGWDNPDKQFYDAFMGSTALGEILARHPKVTVCLGGHQHRALEKSEGTYRYYRVPLGNMKEGPRSVAAAAAASVKIIDL